MARVSLIVWFAWLVALPVAAGQVQVVGLFSGAAVLLVNGERQLVRAGEVGPGGVEVVSADAGGAVLRVDGVSRHYPLSRDFSQAAPAMRSEQVSIASGGGGHYRVTGSINGQTVGFLVDTGATAVAMNEGQARRLGIDYRNRGTPISVATASGTARAWRVPLSRVKVGAIEVLGVEGVVLEGGSPSEVLLGMSYLSRVRWGEHQGVLRLEAKH